MKTVTINGTTYELDELKEYLSGCTACILCISNIPQAKCINTRKDMSCMTIMKHYDLHPSAGYFKRVITEDNQSISKSSINNMQTIIQSKIALKLYSKDNFNLFLDSGAIVTVVINDSIFICSKATIKNNVIYMYP